MIFAVAADLRDVFTGLQLMDTTVSKLKNNASQIFSYWVIL